MTFVIVAIDGIGSVGNAFSIRNPGTHLTPQHIISTESPFRRLNLSLTQ